MLPHTFLGAHIETGVMKCMKITTCILNLCNRFKRYKKTLDEWQNADQIHLIKLLRETYYNLQIIKDNIIQNGGSIQQIEGIPDHIKKKYKIITRIIHSDVHNPPSNSQT